MYVIFNLYSTHLDFERFFNFLRDCEDILLYSERHNDYFKRIYNIFYYILFLRAGIPLKMP